ncbi:MAG: PASTA domain-containing protein [Nitrospirales bacterium]|nr:PASTA domain-containing protein [Nitrospirales bacterium]
MRGLLRGLGYLLVLIVAAVVSAHITVKLLSLSRDLIVPDLRGKEMIVASEAARKEGLYLRLVGEDYDPVIRAGFIMRQDIPPGNKVKEGREIRVVLSRGPKVKEVPDAVGQTLHEAEAIFRNRGVSIDKVIYVHTEAAPKDQIVAQRPEPHEKGSDTVSVIVSIGNFEEEK